MSGSFSQAELQFEAKSHGSNGSNGVPVRNGTAEPGTDGCGVLGRGVQLVWETQQIPSIRFYDL